MKWQFNVNGDEWKVRFVEPHSITLIDRSGIFRLATTDVNVKTVYLSDRLTGAYLEKVLRHEVGHCVMHSYGLTELLHNIVKPAYWIDAEEWLCNYLTDYGIEILEIVDKIIRGA